MIMIMVMTMMTLRYTYYIVTKYVHAFAFPSTIPIHPNKPNQSTIDKIFFTFYLQCLRPWHDKSSENVIYRFSLFASTNQHTHTHSVFINNNTKSLSEIIVGIRYVFSPFLPHCILCVRSFGFFAINLM